MKFILLMILLLSWGAFACPPCPTNSTTTGTGPVTNLAGCKCINGTYTWDGSTCVAAAAGCSAVNPQTWNTNCTANLAAASNGASSTIANTAPGYVGSATYTCNSGTWSAPTSVSCGIGSCIGRAETWGSCSGTSIATAWGATYVVTNTAPGYTGTATYTCNFGAWSAPSSQTCTVPVPTMCQCGGYTDHGPGGNCSGMEGQFNCCGATYPITNASQCYDQCNNTPEIPGNGREYHRDCHPIYD